ncbi:MAG: hypothetical protein IPI33_17420 [Dehalococcoidia bacterium]|nr:hypothetical protein [Dehalococcoidia bacterium]
MGQAVRAADTLVNANQVELRVAPLPAGKDPDEIAREDPERWRAAIDGAATYPEFLLKRIMAAEPVDSPCRRARPSTALRPVLAAV